MSIGRKLPTTTQEVIVMISSERIGIELIHPREAWRFSPRGIDTLRRLFQELSPYQEQEFDIDEIVKLAAGSEFFLAVDFSHNGAIVGTVRLVVKRGPAGRYGILHDEVVDMTHRGHGIGRALTQRAIDMARQLHLEHIDITSKPARLKANRMYLSFGFELVAAADPLDEESANHYRLTL